MAAALACAAQPAPRLSAQDARSTGWTGALIDTLISLGQEDQRRRNELAQAVAAGDSATIVSTMRADTARSRWLRRSATQRGWPSRSVVGDSAAMAAWLILQHSPFHDWQDEMLPTIERLAARGELPLANLALFADRVLVRRGELQRYGSHFDVVQGRLVPAPIADPERLDERRAAVGLPPMSDYVRMLREQYKLQVVWPPPARE